ncbi:MAG TPA: hypothetical protein PKH31_07075 [Candidatus Sumerlaeota bacterium]|nr:hypothetical protein [Candidatus Sumerlaeota bacterium]
MNKCNFERPNDSSLLNSRPSNWLPLSVIAVSGILVHGIILLNERPFWDGLLIYHLLKTDNGSELFRWFSEAGIPLQGYLHLAAGKWVAQPVLAHRIMTILSLIGIPLCFYGICRVFERSRLEGVQLSILALVYPAYQISAEIILTPFTFFTSLFYFAAFLAFLGRRLAGGWGRIFWLASLAGFLASFTLESLLPFYGGFFGLFVFRLLPEGEKSSGTRGLLKSFLKAAFQNPDYLFLPLVYLGLKQLFFHSYGGYAIYNEVCLNPWVLLRNYWISLKNTIILPFDNAVFFYRPSVMVLVLGFGACLWNRIQTPASPEEVERRGEGRILCLIGLILWLLGVAAYVLAQKPPQPVGIGTRCAILLGVPISLMLLGALRLWVSPQYRTSVYLLLLFAFSVETVESHLDWQGRTVKDLAILRCLQKTPPPADSSLFVVEDHLPMFCTRGREKVQIYDENRYFEWAVLFQEVWPDRIRFGVPATWTDREFLDFLATRRRWPQYGFTDWQPEGKVYRMRITYLAPDWGSEKLAEWNPCGIGLRYLILKLTRPVERQNEFLDNLLKIEFLDVEAEKTAFLSAPAGGQEPLGISETQEGSDR